MNLLISACLIGVSCRYDGKTKPLDEKILIKLKEKHHLIPICPEIMGGLPTPRIPAEITGDRRVLRRDGADITAEYEKGSHEALRLAEFFGCTTAILKARSPSCGRDEIYDGTFSGTLTEDDGITAALFRQNGIRIIREDEIEAFLLEH